MDTVVLLHRIAPGGNSSIIAGVAAALDQYLPDYGINTPLRKAHFLAQGAHESDGFHTLQEYASGRAYEGRKDLGNIHPGDGVCYKGRGIFQCTGRTNYEAYGRKLGVDLVNHPERAADPELSVRIACEYWKAKGLNGWADRDDVKEITRRINGGYNGLAQRKAYLAKAKVALEHDDEPADVLLPRERPEPEPPIEEVPDAPIAAEREKTGVTETGAVLGAGNAMDTIKTGADAINTASEAKESVENLGVGDWLVALASNPRFLISALFLLAIVVGLIWWHFFRKNR